MNRGSRVKRGGKLKPAGKVGKGTGKLTLVSALVIGGALTSTAAYAADAGDATPCQPTAKACVDLSSKQAWLQQNGQGFYGPVPLTSGKPGAETPSGVFKVLWKKADHRSTEFNNAPMPNAVFFTKSGVAFHEGSLEQQSNGCVHLSTTASKKFFDTLNPGDEVQVVP